MEHLLMSQVLPVTGPDAHATVRALSAPWPVEATLKRWVRRLLHEPFCQFLALGLIIFMAVDYRESHSTRYRIDIRAPDIQRISGSYAQQFGTPPTPTQLAAMIDRYVREEIFLREGLALGLDRDDEIVRRRIAQKFEFLQQDLGVPQVPAPAELRTFFEANASRYTIPETRSFTHVFVSADVAGDAAARDRAQQLLVKVSVAGVERAPALGDSFPGTIDGAHLSRAEVARLFGGVEFADAIFSAPLNQWAGPFRSGFGWHLIRATVSAAPRLPRLADIEPQVVRDYIEAARVRQNAAAFEDLRARYAIDIETVP